MKQTSTSMQVSFAVNIFAKVKTVVKSTFTLMFAAALLFGGEVGPTLA